MTIKRVLNGRIRSLKFGREKILKQTKSKYGYLVVGLYKNGKHKLFRVNRLVAEAFIPNPENKPEVNHKDTNKLNNRADTLEWATRSENQLHAFKNKLQIPITKIILQYDLKGNFIKEWESMAEARRQTNISHICCCCKGQRKTAGGFIWKYKEY